MIYTDCQSLINNIENRENIKNDNYLRKNGNLINCADIYKQIFDIIDCHNLNLNLNIKFNHIEGHKPTKLKNKQDIKFSQVDRKVRNKLREIK